MASRCGARKLLPSDLGPKFPCWVAKPAFKAVLLASITILTLGLATNEVLAQSPAPSAEETKQQIESVQRRNRDPFARNQQKKRGFVVGDWVILPEINFGGVYDSNLFSSHANARSGVGFAVQPSVTARRDTGIHNTIIGLQGDVRVFEDSKANSYSGAFNLSHVYEIERGLALSYRGQVARVQDQSNAFSQTGGGPGPNLIYVDPINYTSYYSDLGVNKNFNDAFIGGGASIYANNFNDIRTSTGQTILQSQRDFVQYSAHTRAGVRFLSDLYVFVDPSVSKYTFTNNVPDATGYKLIGGVGSDRLSLFRGEIFGGYQSVSFARSGISDISGATFGGRISWTPTRDFIATISAEHALTPSTISTGALGTFTKADSLSAEMVYNFANRMDLSVATTYSHASYSRSSRTDDTIRARVVGNYYITDSVGVSLSYYFLNNNSSQFNYDYGRNTIILGMRIKL